MSSAPAVANRTALVFGASGITGWAILREALKYPTPSTFQKVIGLTNRPLDRSKFFLPEDSRLVIVPGVDLTAAVDDVVAKLAGIDGIKDVTDVYFAGMGPYFFIQGIKITYDIYSVCAAPRSFRL
jgi:hypothetical protein